MTIADLFAGRFHQAVARDAFGGSEWELQCTHCGNGFSPTHERIAGFLANGWPKCCNATMQLDKLAASEPEAGREK